MSLNSQFTKLDKDLNSGISKGHAIFEFTNEHDLKKFIKDTKEYYVDGFTCYHVPSERYFILSYREFDVIPVLSQHNTIKIHVRMKGDLDESFAQSNKEDGVQQEEITTEFVKESMVMGFAAARLDQENRIHSDLILKELRINKHNIELNNKSHPLPNGFDYEDD